MVAGLLWIPFNLAVGGEDHTGRRLVAHRAEPTGIAQPFTFALHLSSLALPPVPALGVPRSASSLPPLMPSWRALTVVRASCSSRPSCHPDGRKCALSQSLRLELQAGSSCPYLK